MATEAQYPPGYLEESKQQEMYTESIVFIVIVTVITALRFVSRYIARVKWQVDDTLVVLSWAFYVTFVAVIIGDVKFAGVGLHEARAIQLRPNDLEIWAKYFVSIAILYGFTITLPKLAVLSLFISIFPRASKTRTVCYVTGAIVIALMIVDAVASVTLCIPLRRLWDLTVPGHCANVNEILKLIRIVNIILDGVMLAIPIPRIWGIQNSIRLKMGLTITFSIGSAGLAAAIITLYKIASTNVQEDVTWSAAITFFWAEIETGMYHITACLVAYKPLLTFLWRKVMPSSDIGLDTERGIYPKGTTSGHFSRITNTQDDTIKLVRNPHLEPSFQSRKPGDILVERNFAINETRGPQSPPAAGITIISTSR